MQNSIYQRVSNNNVCVWPVSLDLYSLLDYQSCEAALL